MTQIQKKWLGLNQVDGARTLLDNDQSLRAKKANGDIVDLMKLNPSDVLELKESPIVPAPKTVPLALATYSQVTDLRDIKPDRVLYVSKLGSDSNVGSKSAPYLTVEAAQNYAVGQGASSATPWLIEVGQGIYLESSTFTFKSGVYIRGLGKNPFNGTATSIRRVVSGSVATIAVDIPAAGFPCYLLQDLALGTPNGPNAGQPSVTFTRDQSVPANITTYAGVTFRGSAAAYVKYVGCGAGADKIVLDRNASITKLEADSVWTDVVDASTVGGALILSNASAINSDDYRLTFDNVNFYSSAINIFNSRVLGQVTATGKIRFGAFASRLDSGVVFDAQGTSPEIFFDAISYPTVGTISFTNGAVATMITKAESIRFVPAVNGNWNSVPSNVKQGLDELASRIQGAEDSGSASNAAIQAALDQEIIDRANGDSNLQSQIDNLLSPYNITVGAYVITEDADLYSAADNTSLASLLPFSDDDPTSLVEGDFYAGAIIIANSALGHKVFMVVDNGGTLEVISRPNYAPNTGILVQKDLIDTNPANELNALYVISSTGNDVALRLGSVSFSTSNGIVVGTFSALSGVDSAIVSTDTVNEALNKLASSMSLRASEISSLQSDVSNIQSDNLGIHTAIEGLQSDLGQEITDRQSADTNLQNQINTNDSDISALQQSVMTPKKELITISSTDVANGYVDLQKLIVAESLNFSTGRLMMVEGASEDYTLSTSGGVTRITFLNDLVAPSPSALADGDKISLSYLFKASEN